MSLVNAYATIEELQAHIAAQGDGTFPQAEAGNMTIAIQSISEWLDDYFDTTFYARTETRYYTPRWFDLLYVDDLLSITTLKTDDDNDGVYENTWATTDYWLEPENAALGRKPIPYRQIRRNVNGDYSFTPKQARVVEIVGSWGYCTEANRPEVIKQYVLLAAHRIWKRKDAIFGVAGSPALGVQVIQAQIQRDSDLMMLLAGISKRIG